MGSDVMFEPKIKNKQTDLLMKAILALDSEEDAYAPFPRSRASASGWRSPGC